MDGVSYFLTGFLRQGNAALARAYLGVGSGGGIPEAPIDGTFYGRENAAWVHAPTVSIPNADATHTGLLTAADWVTFNAKQPAGAYITDAPSDGNTYGRKNGAWTPLTTYVSPLLQMNATSVGPLFAGTLAHGLVGTPMHIWGAFVIMGAGPQYPPGVNPAVGTEVPFSTFYSGTVIATMKLWADSTNLYYDGGGNTFNNSDCDWIDCNGNSPPLYAIDTTKVKIRFYATSRP